MGTPSDNAIHLTIHRRGDVNIVDLAEVGALIPRGEVQVDDSFLTELCDEMRRLGMAGQKGGAPPVRSDLERVGGLVYSHLLAAPARRRLREASGRDLYLRLDERLIQVPWELCHDGESFLATKLKVGRQVITGQPIPEPRALERPRDHLRVLLIADPTDTLPQAMAEGEQLCALLDRVPGIETTFLAGKSVRRIPLLATMQDHDIVHFSGHSHYDAKAPARSGWLLSEGVLTASEMSKLGRPPLLVFSNSCEAGASGEWTEGYRYDGDAFGIGSAFLLAGVRNYVGTFWVVHDEESVALALTCYRHLAAGESLGGSLLEARRAMLADPAQKGLSWACYVLYGDPSCVPLRKDGASEAAPAEPARASQPIETVTAAAKPSPEPRYRYAVEISGRRAEMAAASAVSVVRTASTRVVGREDEVARLEDSLELALRGERQLVFVSGPAGIGKTAVVDEFLRRVAARGAVWIGQGQSVEQYGSGEAYLPVLEALSRLCRGREGGELLTALRRHAPTWIAQMPGLLSDEEHEALRKQAASKERMLRELGEFVEVATSTRPLVLVLEDLHWSDHSTLELLAYLAERRGVARLLLIGTHRPSEGLDDDHPLRSISGELRARGRSRELRLRTLALDSVREYLRERYPGATLDPQLVSIVHRRTEGHPLFMVNVIDYMRHEGWIVEDAGGVRLEHSAAEVDRSVPETLRNIIARQAEALAENDRRLLQAASAAGQELCAAGVAAALESDLATVEEALDRLAAREQFLRADGVERWPDGTLSGRYRFVHALYESVLYEQVPPARRLRLHQRIAERKEKAFGSRAVEVAGELAAHFAAARDARRALHYHSAAGDNAVARYADREATAHFDRSMELVSQIEDQGERRFVELLLLMKLVGPVMSTQGFASPRLEGLFRRARELCREIEEGPHLFPVLRGMMSFHQVRAEHPLAREIGEEMLALLERSDDVIAHVQGHYGHGVTLFDLVIFDDSERHLERAVALYDPAQHPAHIAIYGGYDPGVGCRCWLAWIQWHRGYFARADESLREAIQLAEQLEHPFSLNWAYLATAMLKRFRGDSETALDFSRRATHIAREQGFEFQLAVGTILEGWSRLGLGQVDEAIAMIRSGLDNAMHTGARATRPAYLALLASALASKGDRGGAFRLVDEGLAEAEATSQRLHLVDLNRVRGDLFAASGDAEDMRRAEECYRRAVGHAGSLGTTTLALGAAFSFSRFLSRAGRDEEARIILSEAAAAMPEGIPDLRGSAARG